MRPVNRPGGAAGCRRQRPPCRVGLLFLVALLALLVLLLRHPNPPFRPFDAVVGDQLPAARQHNVAARINSSLTC